LCRVFQMAYLLVQIPPPSITEMLKRRRKIPRDVKNFVLWGSGVATVEKRLVITVVKCILEWHVC